MAAQAHEALLRQKSRSRWLKEGDCNTKFFHIRVNANRNRNSIKGLLIEGVWTDDPNKVKEEIGSFFSNRFLEADFQRPKIDGIFFKSLDHQHVQVADKEGVAACQALWGDVDLAWEWQPAVNAAGRLLCVWNNKNFQVDFRVS